MGERMTMKSQGASTNLENDQQEAVAKLAKIDEEFAIESAAREEQTREVHANKERVFAGICAPNVQVTRPEGRPKSPRPAFFQMIELGTWTE